MSSPYQPPLHCEREVDVTQVCTPHGVSAFPAITGTNPVRIEMAKAMLVAWHAAAYDEWSNAL